MKRIVLLTLLITFVVFGCAQKKESIENGALLDANIEKSVAPSQLASTSITDIYSDGKTKLIKTANFRFEVDNVKRSTDAIMQSIRKYPAYISSSNLRLENPILENKMTVRVQNEYFNELLQEIDQQAKFVNHRDVNTADVSKDFVDLESRLKTKREVEARYMDILRKKAGTIEELLNAERQIGELHEEIEATISRINYLREQVGYSTINLEFYQTITQEIVVADEPGLIGKFSDALKTGWQGVIVIGIAVAYMWPLIITGFCVMMFLRIKNIRKTRKQILQPGN